MVIALAELAEDAGVPDNPGAWLMATAKRRAIDAIRRDKMRERKHEEIARDLDETSDNAVEAIEAAMDDDLGVDELLGLHLRRVPSYAVIRRTRGAHLASGRRPDHRRNRPRVSHERSNNRAAHRPREEGDRLRMLDCVSRLPAVPERAARLPSVLEVVYLIFNEGYAATAGDDLVRPGLCLEGQRLGRILTTGLMPDDPEVLGLLALMEIQASRLSARTGPGGVFVPLTEQNRARWDQFLIQKGLAALARAGALGGAKEHWGPYILQAALAACHARARKAADTDWQRIAALYDRLRTVMPSPVVDLNRAIAHSMAFGPEAGLKLLDEIADAAALRQYSPLPAARGDFLFRAGRLAEARSEFQAAATLTRNARERAFLIARADACDRKH